MNKVLKIIPNILLFSVWVIGIIVFGTIGFFYGNKQKTGLKQTPSAGSTALTISPLRASPAVRGVEVTPTVFSTATPKPKKLDGNRLFNLVNDYRAKNGLKQLAIYPPLCEFAKIRAGQIKNDWSHSGYDQAAADGELFKTICPDCAKVGENLAKDYPTEEAVLQAWIASPYHKGNLDGDWDWGCAVYYSNNFATFLFGKKK